MTDALPLPTAAPEALLDTTGRRPTGETVGVTIDGDAITIGDARLPLDDRLGATLAWTDPAAPELRLELRSVIGATERRVASLCTQCRTMPEWANVELIRQQRGEAVEVDADAMQTVLARVRATLEASGPAEWVPRGEVVVQLPVPALPFVPLVDADLPSGETHLALVPAGADASAIVVHSESSASSEVAVPAGIMAGGVGLLVGMMAIPSVGVTFAMVLGAALAMALGFLVHLALAPSRKKLVGDDTLTITADHVEFPGGPRVARRAIATLDGARDPERLHITTVDGDPISVESAIRPALVVTLLEKAWDTSYPQA